MAFRLMIAGGGTGGHLFPGVAVAEEFLRRSPEARVLFVGTGRPVEAEVLGRRGFENRVITASGLKGRGPWGRVRSLASIPIGLFQAVGLIREFKPDAILGVGGYVSGPVGLAGRLLGKITAIHEQNSVPGLANRYLGRIVNLVFISFESSRSYFPPDRTHLTGNPIRREILEAMDLPAPSREGFTVLIAGGSQGASAVNEAAIGAMRILSGKLKGLRVIHQTGQRDEAAARAAYEELGLAAEVKPFITDMERAYRAADLVVCRAGALTLAEVAALGRPSLLIPLPTAADNHQEINARSLVEAGAAEMMLQAEATPERLAGAIERLAGDPESLARMAEAARKAALPGAAGLVCDLFEEYARTGRVGEGRRRHDVQ